MPLAQGQVSVNGLLMGPGSAYIVHEFNPWTRSNRADQGDKRAWGHGAWSGAEWADEVVIPMTIVVRGSGTAGWLANHLQLLAAFAPTSDDVELRFEAGGVEYLMRGRPRVVEPDVRTISSGLAFTKAAFAALDPLVYSAVEHSVTLGLPSSTGGLTLPLTVPVTVPATVTSGRTQVTNAGTADVGLLLRIDGPVTEPRVSLLTSAGTTTLRLYLTLTAGQWLDIDTGSRTVYLNGTASRRGQAAGGWPLLPAAETAELAFDAAMYDPLAQLTATWRDAWH